MRIGIDLGGTKIEGIVLGGDDTVLARRRVATPQHDYEATVRTVVELVATLEASVDAQALTVGVGTPGAVSRLTGAMKNCNSTCLIGRHFREDVGAALGREVRISNDADCLALSEAADGAARGAAVVFAAILGTGVGGGIAVQGALLNGANTIAGEWGHNLLPGVGTVFENEDRTCYCGRRNCIETYLSGPGLSHTFVRLSGREASAAEIGAAAAAGDAISALALQRYQQQLAYALSQVVNILDPQVVVLGGGVSQIASLYEAVPQLWNEHIFSDLVQTRLLPAQHGDASGVRGAARLWAVGG
jgi:predicted NBD/HSP70 family sugar kinase